MRSLLARFVHGDSIPWAALRLTSILIGGMLATAAVGRCLDPHCSESLIWGSIVGPPLGFGLASGVLSHLRRRHWPRTVAMTLSVAFVSCVFCATTVPTLFGTVDRGKQKWTIADMRRIGHEIEAGRPIDRAVDGWGTSYEIQRQGKSYTIVSYGDCGAPDVPAGTDRLAGATTQFSDDLVYSDGHFVRYPMGGAP